MTGGEEVSDFQKNGSSYGDSFRVRVGERTRYDADQDLALQHVEAEFRDPNRFITE